MLVISDWLRVEVCSDRGHGRETSGFGFSALTLRVKWPASHLRSGAGWGGQKERLYLPKPVAEKEVDQSFTSRCLAH
jgi:hypothetical protein